MKNLPPYLRKHMMRAVIYLCALNLFNAGSLLSAEPDNTSWDHGFFKSSPETIIAESAKISPQEGADTLVLYEDMTVEFDESNRSTTTSRIVVRLENETGVGEWETIEADWEPWYQEKPVIRARVITPDGSEYKLDPETIGEYPASPDSPQVFDDQRIIQAPLPAVTVGAVVEKEVISRDTVPLFEQGVVRYFYPRYNAPVLHSRFSVKAPAAAQLRYVVRQLPSTEPKRTESGNTVRLVFEFGRTDPVKSLSIFLPGRERQFRYVAVSTGKTWKDIASSYSDIVDSRMDLTAVDKLAADTVRGATNREERIMRLLGKVLEEVRYTGLEFGDAALVPSSPLETLSRKYGDCKDQAALLVSLLRSAGIPSHIALLRTWPMPEIEPDLPGIGVFNHAIVYIPGEMPLWLDPTDGWARPGNIPVSDQGRLALIVSPDTQGITEIPAAASSDNRTVETREVFFAEEGEGKVIETTETWGLADSSLRQSMEAAEKDTLKKDMEPYVQGQYRGGSVTNIEFTPPEDLSVP